MQCKSLVCVVCCLIHFRTPLYCCTLSGTAAVGKTFQPGVNTREEFSRFPPFFSSCHFDLRCYIACLDMWCLILYREKGHSAQSSLSLVDQTTQQYFQSIFATTNEFIAFNIRIYDTTTISRIWQGEKIPDRTTALLCCTNIPNQARVSEDSSSTSCSWISMSWHAHTYTHRQTHAFSTQQ